MSGTGWTTASDLKAQLHRRWERGEWLRGLVNGETVFPVRLALRGPTSAELAERFDAVRTWIAELAAVPHIRIEWRTIQHRIVGAQRLPRWAQADGVDDVLAVIGKCGEAAQFRQLAALARERQPKLLAWMEARPLDALALGEDWERLLAVVEWLQRHPRPGVYLRQVDVPGVHSKFIEAHRGVLAEWLDLALPQPSLEARRAGVAHFAARYGFRDKPVRIRFRVLDARLAPLPGPCLPDVALDAESFACLTAPILRVFITENETNFLAFPPARDSIVIFGAGYGWDALARARWLDRCRVHYWGDIDTHGFAILSQLRSHFGHATSFLMDRSTLMAHESLWGEEAKQVIYDLRRLTDAEQALFDDLRDNRIRQKLRLEQERIGFHHVIAALEGILGGEE